MAWCIYKGLCLNLNIIWTSYLENLIAFLMLRQSYGFHVEDLCSYENLEYHSQSQSMCIYLLSIAKTARGCCAITTMSVIQATNP